MKLASGFFITILLSFSLSSSAWAYLPQPRVILARTAANQGSGAYQIDSLVEISSEKGQHTFRETWIIENENSFLLTVKSEKPGGGTVQFSIRYDGDGKTFFNQKSLSQSLPAEFFEKFWLARSMDSLGRLMIKSKVAPTSVLQRRSPPKSLTEPHYAQEPFLRLGRFDGVINWVFSMGESQPSLWVEQDQFIIRRLRFNDQTEIRASRFSTYAKALHYPKSRVVKWGPHQATLTTTSVSSLPSADATKKVSAANLDASSSLQALEVFSSQPAIAEFYSRFR